MYLYILVVDISSYILYSKVDISHKHRCYNDTLYIHVHVHLGGTVYSILACTLTLYAYCMLNYSSSCYTVYTLLACLCCTTCVFMCVYVCACQVLKVFIDNPFPIALMKQQIPIRCLDLSARSLITDSCTCTHYVISGHDTQWLLTYNVWM